MNRWTKSWLMIAGSALLALPACTLAETCITQSQMPVVDRDAMASAAANVAQRVLANDIPGFKAATIPQFADGIGAAAATLAPKLKGDSAQVDQVYFLDASMLKPNPDGSAPDASFACVLNKGTTEADFTINSLPPGRYAYALVKLSGASPYLLSMLLRQEAAAAPWKLAGLFPKASIAGGHDGLWYWKQARAAAAAKQPWAAYVYFQQAQQLLQPAGFVSSTHLDNLRIESQAALPPKFPNGVSSDSPLVVQGSDGTQYKINSLVPDDSLQLQQLDVAMHLDLQPGDTDQAAHQRNLKAIAALVTTYPELRTAFHGVWVFSEAPDKPPVGNELVMADIH